MRYGLKVLTLEVFIPKDIRRIAGETMDIVPSSLSGTKAVTQSALLITGVVAEATNGYVQARRQSKLIRGKSNLCVRGLSLRPIG
jgi:hypothetical protein